MKNVKRHNAVAVAIYLSWAWTFSRYWSLAKELVSGCESPASSKQFLAVRERNPSFLNVWLRHFKFSFPCWKIDSTSPSPNILFSLFGCQKKDSAPDPKRHILHLKFFFCIPNWHFPHWPFVLLTAFSWPLLLLLWPFSNDKSFLFLHLVSQSRGKLSFHINTLTLGFQPLTRNIK